MYELFFIFKQKTAYEVRISGGSSDVCSSDLADGEGDDVGQQRGRKRQDRGKPEPAADDVGDRQLELEGIAKVALQQADQPQPVLLDERPGQAILPAQEVDARRIDVPDLRPQLAGPGLPVVAGRARGDEEDTTNERET